MVVTTALSGAAEEKKTHAHQAGKEVPERGTELPAIVAEAPGKTDVALLPLDVKVVGNTTIERSAETSLLPVLVNNVAGLFVTERGFAGYGVSGGAAGAVNIRGVGQGNKVLFMIDGQPQWAGVFGHALPDTYVTNGVERVEVVKGPSSLLYGSNAMGGSVNIITRRSRHDGFSGRARAEFGSFSTQKFGLTAGLRRGKFGATLAGALDRSNGYRAGSAFWNANEFMQFQYNPDSRWETGVSAEMNQTHADNPGTMQSPLLSMWTEVKRGQASVYAKDNYGMSSGGVQAFVSWGSNQVDDGYSPGAAPKDYIFHSTDYNMGFTLYQTLNLWRGNNLSAGFDMLHWGGEVWNTDKVNCDIRSAEFKGKENEIAGYVMMQQDVWGEILSINGGVRLQHGSQYGNEWVPQAGFILKPYAGGSLKFSFGKGFRAPNLKELYLYKPANPDLKPEYMWNYDVEMRQQLLGNRLNVGVSLYFINGRDMIQTVNQNGRPLNVNTGRFINKGFEIEAQYRVSGNWSAGGNYSYLHSNNSNLIGAPKNKLNLMLDYTGGPVALTLESNSVMGLYTGGGDVQSYTLLNFRGAYTFRSRADVSPFVKIDNILNRHYEILYGCPMPGLTLAGGVEIKF